jgi:hypothetical protein
VPVKVYGCVLARKRAVMLGSFNDYTHPVYGEPQLNAPYAAYALDVIDETCAKYEPTGPCESQHLEVVDLRTGKTRVSVPGGADRLALTGNGWLAWVTTTAGSPTQHVVSAVDSHGRRQLDAGNIDPATLVAHGNSVQWQRDGAPMTATLG